MINGAICVDVGVSRVVGGELEVAEWAALIQVEHSHTLQGRVCRGQGSLKRVYIHRHITSIITSMACDVILCQYQAYVLCSDKWRFIMIFNLHSVINGSN